MVSQKSKNLARFFYLPRNAWILTSTSAVWSVGSAMANPYQTLYFSALGASSLTIGLLIGYGTAITVISTLIGGYIADTWGRKQVVIVFSWASVFASFVYFLINSTNLIIVPLTIASVSSIYNPAFNSIMMDSIEPADRIRGFSVFNAINTFPSVFAPTFGGILMNYLGVYQGIKFAYLGSAIFGVIAVSIRTRELEETHIVNRDPSLEKYSIWYYIKNSLSSGVRAIKDSAPIVRRLLVYVTLAGIGTGLTSPYVSLYVVNQLKISPISYSLVVDLAGVSTVSLLLGVVVLIQRMGAKRSTLIASVAAPVSNIMFAQAKTMDELLEWGVTGAVATALQTPSLATMEAEAIPKSERGKILAMFSIFPAIVSLPSSVAAGYLYSLSPVSPFVVSLLPFAGAAIILSSA
ncbi:MAG: MFS transporter [Thaumarchaeota archaeon]|nr:MFS transporter [Nitrososphaerota archaeon]